jgi:hypothetical protein
VFTEPEHASKACSLITMLKDTTHDESTARPTLQRTPSEDIRLQQAQEEAGLFRARAIISVPQKKPSDLLLNKDDTVIVIKKLSSDFWLGKANGNVGEFPAACVDVIFDPANSYLEQAGYVHLHDLPSAADWKLVCHRTSHRLREREREKHWH